MTDFLGALVMAVLAIGLVGCGSSPGNEHLDVAQYASTNRTLPEWFLKQSGAPLQYEKMPFTCGTPFMHADEEETSLTLATQPEKVRADVQRMFEETLPPPRLPFPPEPEYVVDLTKVEEVRLGWLGGKRIVVLTHAISGTEAACPWNHPIPPARLVFQGPHMSGAGPVSIWQDGQFLYFTNEPWMLVQAQADKAPMLMTISDHYRIGGPIEMGFTIPTAPPKIAPRAHFWCWLDSEVTGGYFVLTPLEMDPSLAPIIHVTRLLDGVDRDYGSLRFDGADGSGCFVAAQATSQPDN